LIDFLKTFFGDENYVRLQALFRDNVTLVASALLVIVPLRVIERWFSSGVVKGLAGDSASILTAGLVLSFMAQGIERFFQEPYLRNIVHYGHEGIGFLVVAAIFLRAWKTFKLGRRWTRWWAAIRSARGG
jgi:hypothetical protein